MPVQAEKLLPHRGKMLLIDTVLTAAEGAGTAVARPDEKSIARGPDGKIMTPFHVEFIAQTYAAVCGCDFITRGLPVPEGFLVGVQKFEIHPQQDEYSDQELLISVQTLGEFNGFAVVEGTVSCEGRVLAEGRIKLLSLLTKRQKSGHPATDASCFR